MSGERKDPTQQELDFLFKRGFEWIRGYPNKWLFEKNRLQYDLSAADITQIEDIEKNGRFIYNRLEAA